MSAWTPGRTMIDARRMARRAGLLLIEKPGPIWYIYRPLADGTKTFLGKRGKPRGVLAYVERLAAIK